MAVKQSGGLYNLFNSQTVENLERNLNYILSRIADRLDRVEGLRGNPTFYKNVFDMPSGGLSAGQVLRATSSTQAEITTLDVSDVDNATPSIPSGLTAQIDIEKSLISLIDGENDYVVHQFPTQWLEYNCEVFMFTTNESFQSLIIMGGDVVGPTSAVDSRIAEFDGTTGKAIKDGGITHASLMASNAHQIAEDAVSGIIEGNGAGSYSAVSELSGWLLTTICDDNGVVIHQYPMEWLGLNNETFMFLSEDILPVYV